MAKFVSFPPKEKIIYQSHSQRVIVDKCTDKDVEVFPVEENGKRLSFVPIIMTKSEWNAAHFFLSNETEKSSSEESQSHKENGYSSNTSKFSGQSSHKYYFSYNPETKKIDVFGPDGERVHEFDIIKGRDGVQGRSSYEDWARHQPADKQSVPDYLDYIAGKKGTDGKSAYELWTEGKPSEEATRAHFFSFLHGTDGKNGKSAFELWAEKQPGGVGTWEAFVAAITGTDGKNGLDAYEIWAGAQSEDKRSREEYLNFIAGKPGKNGESIYELWLRLYPHEGQVTEEDFFRWIAKQVPTVDGATYIPSIDGDGKLYFINSRTHECTEVHHDLKGKDGKTYHPIIHDNYLWFEDVHGQIYGQKVRIKGDTGKEGPRGKSAYELWRDDPLHPENADKTLDDYRRSLKGEDGHNVTATHDYLKDLKDYTCPIHTINPYMIISTDSLQGADSAEQTIEHEKAKINNIRREGEEYHNHGSWIQEFFWWCAGADRPLLRMCPGEHSKYMGIGSVIFFTGLMAWFSSFIAMQLVFGEKDITAFGTIGIIGGFITCAALVGLGFWLKKKPLSISSKEHRVLAILSVILGIIAVILGVYLGLNNNGGFSAIFATFWALMIFFLDRFITNTMYSDGKVTISWLELRSVLPRIVIAIFLGIVISAPLELMIFKDEIQDNLKRSHEKVLTDYYKEKVKKDNDSIIYLNTLLAERYGVNNQIAELNKQIRKNDSTIAIRRKEVRTVITDDPRSEDPQYIAAWTQKAMEVNNVNEDAKNKASGALESVNDGLKTQVIELSTKKDTSQIIEDLRVLKGIKAISDSNFKLSISPDSLSLYADKAGLHANLEALHELAYQEEQENGYKPWPKDQWYLSWYIWAICIFMILCFVSSPFWENVIPAKEINTDDLSEEEIDAKEKEDNKERRNKGARVILPWLAVVALICGTYNEILFHALPYFIFSVVGMIMMLFILIDVSPVFYKMMLADGVYDKLLHKEKLLAEDAIRLNAAKAYANVTNSEIGRLAPFVFGKTSEKLKRFLGRKITLKSDEVECEDDNKCKGEGKPELSWDSNYYTEVIDGQNRETFDYVLSLKKRLVEAAYLAWYRDSRDSILGIVEHKDDLGKPEDMFTEESGNSTTEDNPHVDSENNSGEYASESKTETKAEDTSETNTQTEDNTEPKNSEEEHVVDEDGDEHETLSDETFTTE